MGVEKVKKIVISGTIACIILGSTGAAAYTFTKANPFDGNEIESSSLSTSTKEIIARMVFDDENFIDAKNYIKRASDDEKKAYLTGYPVAISKDLSLEEKQELPLIQFYLDTEIDNEYVYRSHNNININKNIKFEDSNVSETYNRGKNVLNIQNQKKEFHGLLHATTPQLNNSDNWLEESIVSLAEAEYKGIDDDYRLCVNTDRFLCEILGRKLGIYTIVGARYRNDMGSITKALEQKGIPKEMSEELYLLLDEYRELTSEITTPEIKEQRINICRKTAKILANMYDIANDNPERETVVVKILLEHIMLDKHLDLNKYKFYYWNSKKKAEYQQFCILNYGVNENTNLSTITYIDDYNIATYKIDENNEEVLVSSSTINDRFTLDKAKSYNEYSITSK